MLLFAKSDEADRYFKEAQRLIKSSNEEGDIDQAIQLLEKSVMLKPFRNEYSKKLTEAAELRSKLREKYLMSVEEVLEIRGGGIVATGRIQQGVVYPGAEVRIVGPRGEKRVMVASLEIFYKNPTRAVPGETVGLWFSKLGMDDVQRGDTIEKVAT